MAVADKDDKTIIYEYLNGDEKSLEILIQRYLKPIYSFVYRNVGDQAFAEDITQEVFVKVWKNIKKFDQKRDFKPWIFQIAKNASIDYLRKKKSIPFSRFENERGENALIENMASEEVDLIETISDKETISLALKNLSEKDQKIINLRHKEGRSFKNIAQIMKESINTVKSRYRRIIMHLKKDINIKEK